MWLSLFAICLAIAICLGVAATISAINNPGCPFPLTEMHPIPSRAGSTSQVYRIAADQSAGMEGEPQGSLRARLAAPVVLLFSLGHPPVAPWLVGFRAARRRWRNAPTPVSP